ncbi:MAG TPA: transporter substrate-binding domain-containing protein [Burkholderiaceae bacterium]|nr:transporter substrate-binding domain-containing protein [Burkholderiaceae bacterium]
MSPLRRTLICAACVLTSVGAIAQTALDDITKAGVIRVAVPTDYPPYGFVGVDMKPLGLDVDMANYIAAKLGVRAELVPVTSTNRVPYLQTRKVDIVVSTLARNAEREKVVDFTTAAYSPFISGVYGPKSVTIKGFADLQGKVVGVTRGTIEDQELTKAVPNGTNLLRFEDHAATIAALSSGQVMAVGSSQPAVSRLMQTQPQLGLEYKLMLSQSPNFIGITKGEEKLRARINDIVVEARKSGDADRLSNKWLGRPTGDIPL